MPFFMRRSTTAYLLLQEREARYELTGPLPPLAIPTTLHDSLTARLDRLTTVKALAQLAATLGREFSYALLLPQARQAHGGAPVAAAGHAHRGPRVAGADLRLVYRRV